MHPFRRAENKRRGIKLSGRQWRKLRKAEGFMTTKIARRYEGVKQNRRAYRRSTP